MDNSRKGVNQEAFGLIDSLASFAGKPVDAPTFGIGDFQPLPKMDSDRLGYKHTILDSDFVRGKMADPSSHNGFYFDLPEVKWADGSGEAVIRNNKAVSRIFVPFMELEGQGDQVFKRLMQRQISDIYEKSAQIEQMKAGNPGGRFNQDISSLYRKLGNSVNAFGDNVRKQLTSSDGVVLKSALKAKMPSSSSGLLKILPPEHGMAMGEEVTYISRHTAKGMGIEHILDQGGDYYTTNLRYPAFHSEAIAISKLRISEDLAHGEHLVTPMIAKMLRGDSDGDYNHILGFGNLSEDHRKLIQGELAGAYERQAAEAMRRRDTTWKGAISDGLKDLYQNQFGDYGTKPPSFALEDLGNGTFKAHTPNGPAEVTAKSGKAFVGMASDINYQLRQLGSEYLVEGSRDKTMLENFGTGLEQKLISMKHNKDDTIEVFGRSGALEFIQAIQGQDWSLAEKLDQQHFEGQFAKDYNLTDASRIMQSITERHPTLRAGTSSGVTGGTDAQLFAALQNADEKALKSNPVLRMLHELMGIEHQEANRAIPINGVDGGGIAREAGNYIDPKVWHAVNPADLEIPRSAIERSLSKARTAVTELLTNSPTARYIGIGALAAGGVFAAYNAVNPITVMPENRPYNQEQFQPDAPPQEANIPQTARLEQNGQGLHVQVKGKSPGHLNNDHIAGMISNSFKTAGVNANVNINSKDDTSTINQGWMQEKFGQLLTNGYVNG